MPRPSNIFGFWFKPICCQSEVSSATPIEIIMVGLPISTVAKQLCIIVFSCWNENRNWNDTIFFLIFQNLESTLLGYVNFGIE